MPGCTVQAYGNVPWREKVRATVTSFTMGMSVGVPAAVPAKITLWPRPSGDSEMRQRIVPPTRISAVVGEKMLPGVNTSTVSGAVGTGVVVPASPPQAEKVAEAASTTPAATAEDHANRGRIMRLGVKDRRWTYVTRAALRRAATRLAGTVTVALLVGCGDGATGPKAPSPSDPAAGTFALVTVNAQPLPFVLFDDSGFKLEYTASTLALQADGQFVLAQTTVETVAGFASTFQDTLRGTWTQRTASVSLQLADGGTAAATWDGTQIGLDLDSEGQVLKTVYRKTP